MARKATSPNKNTQKGSSRSPSSHKAKKRPGYKAAASKSPAFKASSSSVKEYKRKKKALPKKATRKKRYSLGKNKKGHTTSYKKRLSPGQKGIAEIFSRYKLPKHFPDKVAQAVKQLGSWEEFDQSGKLNANVVLPADPLRKDRRDTYCITVDPADAKDFDDAVYAEKKADGTYFLSVHIADVSHYVTPGDPLDKEAAKRTCSVYLADQVIPMLPFKLSDDICSLVPGEERLAMTVEMVLDAATEVLSVDVFPSVIHSKGRFAYETVQDFLEKPQNLSCLEAGEGLPDKKDERKVGLQTIADSLKAADEIAKKRRARRAKAGSLEFESQEMKFVFNKEGVPIKIEKRVPTDATRLIEEAMLLANESVATILSQRDLKTAYRVHEAPKQENLETAVPILREFGLVNNEQALQIISANPHAIEDVLERSKKTPYHFLVSQLLLRAQKKAIYLPDNEGHYALQAPAYLHFTSPIRRYPDVIVHRTVKALLGKTMKTKPYQHRVNNLSAICNACSEGEKRATDAERDSDDVKMAEFYLSRIGKVEIGTIVGMEEFGCFVELKETGAQGLLPTRMLSSPNAPGGSSGDWFNFDEKHLRLTGEKSGISYELGQKLKVRIESVNVTKGYINLDLPPQQKNGKTSKKE